MAFKIVKNPKAWWPVIVPGVTEDGKAVRNEFKMRFRLLDNDEHTDALTAVRPAGELDEQAATQVTADFIMKLAEDWKGVEMNGEDDSTISLPFNRENLLTLIRLPNVADSIYRAYTACRAGEPELRRGN